VTTYLTVSFVYKHRPAHCRPTVQTTMPHIAAITSVGSSPTGSVTLQPSFFAHCVHLSMRTHSVFSALVSRRLRLLLATGLRPYIIT
jgi:hypothetical protein